MKRVITAILPLILVAQVPFHSTSYVPSEWTKSFHYGLKWTELMMNGYPGVAEATEVVPEGDVTTTVVLANAIPEFEDFQIPDEEEFCDFQMKEKNAGARIEALEVLVELKEERVLEIRTAQLL